MILNVTYQNTHYFCQHFDEFKKRGMSLRSWGNQLDFEGKYLPLVRCCTRKTRRSCQKYDEDFFQILWPSQKTQTLSP